MPIKTWAGTGTSHGVLHWLDGPFAQGRNTPVAWRMQPCFWQFRPTKNVTRSIADEMGSASTKSTKKSLPPEGATGLKIEGWGCLREAPSKDRT
ncbi:hypothetical protein LMG24238_03260 [Paraburkholderia sediminicola]|uniref:Uncharacterized protein n=1 Tax=Paraburkholderia sediminicola TaxID=458836 RepID=A0A6J5B827_9BURK|nr:hypothetical protein LMG24238_03260 [Paraburkholderia sediminicola]